MVIYFLMYYFLSYYFWIYDSFSDYRQIFINFICFLLLKEIYEYFYKDLLRNYICFSYIVGLTVSRVYNTFIFYHSSFVIFISNLFALLVCYFLYLFSINVMSFIVMAFAFIFVSIFNRLILDYATFISRFLTIYLKFLMLLKPLTLLMELND
jgi:hypothetical protein